MKRSLVFSCLLALCLPVLAHASVLRAMVVAVHDGNSVTVINVNRPVKVILKAAAAPEEGQPYADVAHRHLADLILGKEVGVDYTALGHNGSLIAKVFWNDMDVGQQMIRDGVAWYDRTYESDLSPLERSLYADSEAAARNERRGIWQDAAPVSPWEFRRAQKTGREMNAGNAVAPRQTPQTDASRPTGPTLNSNNPRASVRSLTTEDIRLPGRASSVTWQKLAPDGEYFSIQAPNDVSQVSAQIPAPPGYKGEAELFAVNHNHVVYIVMWGNEEHNSVLHTDLNAIFDNSLYSFKAGLNRAHNNAGQDMGCEVNYDKDISLNGYAGRQFTISSCRAPGVMRLYYKLNGNKLKMYMVGVLFSLDGDPNVSRFFDSFKISKERNQ